MTDHGEAGNLTVVGIGASAGGLAALRRFFARVPDDSGLAFVVVVHLSPEYESQMAELLQPHTGMPVQQVDQTVPLQKNQVYVIPPGRNLDTIDTHLRPSALEADRPARAPIDHFFRTLARTHDDNSIAVVLTGTGSDGALGLKEIKERGGLTIVQDPNEAEFDGMPQSALATGLVDLVLPLEEIPGQLARFVRTRPDIIVADGEEVAALHRQMLEQYGPPSLLVSPDDRAVHLSADVGRYLIHPSGELTTDIFKLVREELHQELRSALLTCRRTNEATRTKPLHVPHDGNTRRLRLEVQPAIQPGEKGYLLVLFHELEEVPDHARAPEAKDAPDASIRELQADLDFAHRQLRDLSEGHETSREEMRASNEELQSANEELHTANQENRNKVDELSTLTDALQNLMAATDIATLFVDRQLRILRFTPKVGELFNIRPADVRRPLTDLTHRLNYAELLSDVQQVLRELVSVEREVFDHNGRCYLAQVRPYRSSDDRIEGVVLTFVDLTRRKRSEEALRETEEQYRALVQASAQIVWTTSSDGAVVDDSPAWRAFTGQRFDQWVGFGWFDVVHPGDREVMATNWRNCVGQGTQFNAEFRLYHAETGVYRWVAARAVPLRQPGGDVRGWVGMINDVTERKVAEATRVHFQRLFESAPGLYLVLEPEGYTIVTASDAYLETVGVERSTIIGRPLFEAFPNDPSDLNADGMQNLSASLERVRTLRQSDVLALQRYPVLRPDGTFEERFWSALNVPVFGLDGELVYIIHRIEDVTPFVLLMREQDREAEGHQLLESRAEYMQADIALRAAELQRLNEELQALNETLERRVDARTEQVRQLASSLAMAEHDERARVGRILHDNLQQLLYGIQLKMALLAEEAAAAGQDQLKAYADEAQHWIRDAVTTTRQLSVDLSPPLLSDDNLADGLEWLQSQVLEMHNLHVELEVDSTLRLPDEGLRVLLFQTVRELLFNVVKHAKTDRAVVTAHEVEEEQCQQLAIQVSDDGCGFEPAALDSDEFHSGLGLTRMRGRLELFGGRLEIDARPGAGSRLTVYLPRARNTPARDPAELKE